MLVEQTLEKMNVMKLHGMANAFRQWLEKPQSWLPGERASHRSLYTEKHLFEGVVRMKTKTVH